MKLSFALISSAVVLAANPASAGVHQPTVTVGVNAGTKVDGGATGGVEPRVQWDTGALEVGGLDVQGGFDTTINDVGKVPPVKMWARMGKSFGDSFGISLRGEVDAPNPDSVGLDLDVDSMGTNLRLSGTADFPSKTLYISDFQASKSIDAFGGSLSFTPQYDLSESQPNIKVGYATDNSAILVDAEKRELTVTHSFSDNDTIQPTISTSGDFSLKYSRSIAEGKLSASYKPDDAIKMEWVDQSGLVASFSAPVDGIYKVSNKGIKFNVRQQLELPVLGDE